jgi:cysteine desulfuration protein SufE
MHLDNPWPESRYNPALVQTDTLAPPIYQHAGNRQMAANEMPFGNEISAEDVVETLGFFDSWEDRYRYIIDLGKQLPPMPEELKTDDRLVKGCQSKVWINVDSDAGPEAGGGDGDDTVLHFEVDSDAHIVRGLLALVLCAYNGKPPQQILDFPIEDYFSRLELLQHLSPMRGNGLKSVVERIRSIAGKAHAH